jgi:hypothetical protein
MLADEQSFWNHKDNVSDTSLVKERKPRLIEIAIDSRSMRRSRDSAFGSWYASVFIDEHRFRSPVFSHTPACYVEANISIKALRVSNFAVNHSTHQDRSNMCTVGSQVWRTSDCDLSEGNRGVAFLERMTCSLWKHDGKLYGRKPSLRELS